MKVSKEFKAGIIVVITLLGFWWLFQFLKGRDIFSNQDTYYVKYDKVDGLSKSKNVNINGLRVGMVGDITPIQTRSNNISFIVELKIDGEFKFSRNSVAQIVTGFMNGAEINLVLAEDNAAIAKTGDTLQGIVLPGIVDEATASLKPVSENANRVLMRLDSTLIATNQILNERNRQNLESALVNLNQAVSEFNTLGKSANSLVNSNSYRLTSILDNANQMLLTTNTTVEKYGMVANKINESNFDQTIKKLETSINTLNQITEKINSGDGSMSLLINDPGLYNNLNTASQNLSVLLDDLKNNPKRYVQFSLFGRKEKQQPVQTKTNQIE